MRFEVLPDYPYSAYFFECGNLYFSVGPSGGSYYAVYGLGGSGYMAEITVTTDTWYSWGIKRVDGVLTAEFGGSTLRSEANTDALSGGAIMLGDAWVGSSNLRGWLEEVRFRANDCTLGTPEAEYEPD